MAIMLKELWLLRGKTIKQKHNYRDIFQLYDNFVGIPWYFFSPNILIRFQLVFILLKLLLLLLAVWMLLDVYFCLVLCAMCRDSCACDFCTATCVLKCCDICVLLLCYFVFEFCAVWLLLDFCAIFFTSVPCCIWLYWVLLYRCLFDNGLWGGFLFVPKQMGSLHSVW